MKIAYLDCFAGIAGDMFLGALVDAGVDARLLQDAADSMGLGVKLQFTRVDRSGIQSTKARVLVNGEEADAGSESTGAKKLEHAHTHAGTHSHSHTHTHDGVTHTHTHEHVHEHVHGRSLSQIRVLIKEAAIDEGAKAIALEVFEKLGRAEAKIHGVPVDQIHFHEVGAVDAIIDIVCGAVGARLLGVDAWFCSPVNTGSGFVDCAHGRFPVPAPATAELLQGVPIYAEGPAKELTTPTGAALLKGLGCRFDRVPVMVGGKIGYGAGTRNPERFPNVLRLQIGEVEGVAPHVPAAEAEVKESVTVMECSIDDQTPEALAYAAGLVLEQGALDVTQQALLMKKGRQGVLLTVLCRNEDAARFRELLFRETTTLGVREREESRVVLARRSVPVHTEYGEISMKVGLRAGRVVNAAPEFEECRAAAKRHGVALKEVMQAAAGAMCKWIEGEQR